MRISTRVGLGLGIVCAVSAGALAWQWSRIARLADAQQELARVRLPATEVALNLLDLSDLIEIRLRKYQVTRDPGYATAARRACQRFAASTSDLAALAANGKDVDGVDALLQAWAESSLADGLGGETTGEAAAAWADSRLGTAQLELQTLRHEISSMLRAAREESSRQVARSTAITVRALNVSGATLVVVLAISAAVTVVTVRSINRPSRGAARSDPSGGRRRVQPPHRDPVTDRARASSPIISTRWCAGSTSLTGSSAISCPVCRTRSRPPWSPCRRRHGCFSMECRALSRTNSAGSSISSTSPRNGSSA